MQFTAYKNLAGCCKLSKLKNRSISCTSSHAVHCIKNLKRLLHQGLKNEIINLVKYKTMRNKFTKFIAIRSTNDTEQTLAYSEISGRLFVPNGQPTLFNDLNDVKGAIRRTKGYQKKESPAAARKTKYMVYKLNFRLLD